MSIKFKYWQSEVDGQWYFHLIGPNGGVIVQSAGYMTENECLKGIEMVKRYSDIAIVVQPDVDVDLSMYN